MSLRDRITTLEAKAGALRATKEQPMPKQSAHIIAESLDWDVADVRQCRYQRYASPAVYAIGDRYFSAHATKPTHAVGGEWREHADQFGARGTPRRVWVCDAEITP